MSERETSAYLRYFLRNVLTVDADDADTVPAPLPGLRRQSTAVDLARDVAERQRSAQELALDVVRRRRSTYEQILRTRQQLARRVNGREFDDVAAPLDEAEGCLDDAFDAFGAAAACEQPDDFCH